MLAARRGPPGVPLGLKFVGWRRPALKFLKLCRGTILSCGHTIFLKFSKLLKAAAGGGPPQKPDADGQFGTGWGALSACLEKAPSGPKHQVSRIYHLTSNWDDMCGPYMLLHSARSAPEANFLQNPQKCQNWRNCVGILKFPKVLGCRGAQVLKYILGSTKVEIS